MEIQHVSFNQYGSHLTCTTTSGFNIYALNPSIEKKVSFDNNGGVGVMKILNKSNFYIFTGAGDTPFNYNNITSSKTTLILWDHFTKKVLVQAEFNELIRNLQIHHSKRIIVALEKKVIELNFDGNPTDTRVTYSNPYGICEISNDDKPTVVTLGNRKGEIDIWNLTTGTHKIVQAHESNIRCVAISKDGKLVATASEKGTLIRVFCMLTGKQLFEFRRGSQQSTVQSIAFSYNKEGKGLYLACCSTRNNTVHFFELSSVVDTKNTQSVFSGFKDYMPVGSEWVDSKWSFKQHYLENFNRALCDFDETGALHVATYDGKYYKISGQNYEVISSNDLLIGSK